MLATVVAEGVAIALLALLVAGLLRSHAEILRSLHDLGAGIDGEHTDGGVARRGAAASGGDQAHDVVGTRLDGSAAAVAVVGVRHDTVLAFLSTGCRTCAPFWSALARGGALPEGARLLVVAQDEESESRLRQLAGDDLDVLQSSAAWAAYAVPGSPHVVWVDGPSGRIVGEGTAPTWEHMLDLLRQAATDARRRGARSAAVPAAPREDRDDPQRIDAELLAAGIGPGHPSLFSSPDPE